MSDGDPVSNIPNRGTARACCAPAASGVGRRPPTKLPRSARRFTSASAWPRGWRGWGGQRVESTIAAGRAGADLAAIVMILSDAPTLELAPIPRTRACRAAGSRSSPLRTSWPRRRPRTRRNGSGWSDRSEDCGNGWSRSRLDWRPLAPRPMTTRAQQAGLRLADVARPSPRRRARRNRARCHASGGARTARFGPASTPGEASAAAEELRGSVGRGPTDSRN
jgi:hypothetical protein